MGLIRSTYSTAGSITQMSTSLASAMTFCERVIKPTKRPACWATSSVANATPNTSPRTLTRSPKSILMTMLTMTGYSAATAGMRVVSPSSSQSVARAPSRWSIS